MTWSVVNKAASQYVEGIFKDQTSWQDIQDLTAQCISLQKTQGTTRFLIDTSEMTTSASISEVYQLPAHEYQKQNVDRQTKIALVYSPSGESQEIIAFYETACINRGWQARKFTSRQEAISWLTVDIESK